MLEIRNRKTLQSKVNICKSDVKIGDYADSLAATMNLTMCIYTVTKYPQRDKGPHRGKGTFLELVIISR